MHVTLIQIDTTTKFMMLCFCILVYMVPVTTKSSFITHTDFCWYCNILNWTISRRSISSSNCTVLISVQWISEVLPSKISFIPQFLFNSVHEESKQVSRRNKIHMLINDHTFRTNTIFIIINTTVSLPEDLVVFGQTLWTARGSCFNLNKKRKIKQYVTVNWSSYFLW